MAPSPFTTTVHPFPSPTHHACAYETGQHDAKSALVFIGGLGDGPHTVPYPRAIAKELESSSETSYSVFEFRLTSSFSGWGFASLKDDVADISALVKYLRSIGREKIVLMGHSTGCQDCMEYSSLAHRDLSPVDGFILQAPVSDREAVISLMGSERVEKSVQSAKSAIEAGKGNERVPVDDIPKEFGSTPVSYARWYSLAAADGEDNYFSSDIPDSVASNLWGRIEKPLLILPSEKDEFVAPTIDQAALTKRWGNYCRAGVLSDLSSVIPLANHRASHPEARQRLVATVTQFLKGI